MRGLKSAIRLNPVQRNGLGLGLFGVGQWIHWSARSEFKKHSEKWRQLDEKPEKLIRSGIYGHCRHPIYVSVLCMSAATAIIPSNVGVRWAFAASTLALAIYLCTKKIPNEEKELLETFGEEFTHYSNSVPMLIGIRSLKSNNTVSNDTTTSTLTN